MTRSPWLTPEEFRAWRTYRAMATLLEDLLDQQLQREAGLTHLYYGVLVELAESPEGALRMTELATLMRISRSRLTYVIGQFEKRGWVRRTAVEGDLRGQLAVITDEGRAELARVAPGHAQTVRDAVFDRLTPEQVTQLEEISSTILAGLETGEIAPLPWQR